MRKIFTIGVNEDMDEYLKNKVILSNQLAVFLLVVVFLYTFLYISLAPKLLPLIYSGYFIIILFFILNYFGANTLSRLIVSLAPTVISGLLYLGLSQNNDDILFGNALAVFSFTIIPFILFDFREKTPLFISFIFCGICISTHRITNNLVDIKMDNSAFKEPFTDGFSTITAIVTIGASLYILFKINEKTEFKNKELLGEMERKGKEIDLSTKELENTLLEVKKAREEDEKRNWVTTGIAQLSTMLRQENNMELLYDKLISGTVKYINANQGALFVVEGEEKDKYLELVASYAYSRKKFINKRIAPGEGLVGQCFLEKDKIVLREVPDHYINISSGLGDARPRFLVIVPLIVNESVEGVFEIASFRVLQDYEIEFLEKTGENIASVLISNRINTKTKYLLEESQQQSEEMKAQEEEMRQNMEELQATQEEMERKEREYLEKIYDLEAQLQAR